jgi:hypothetical protein
MQERPERVEQFKAEIADMAVPDPAVARDRLLLRLGAALLVIGPVLAVVAYFVSHGTTSPLQQRDAVVLAIIGLTLTVAGAGIFARYSMAQFLRFWMARLSWEQQAQTDRIVDAVGSEQAGGNISRGPTAIASSVGEPQPQ